MAPEAWAALGGVVTALIGALSLFFRARREDVNLDRSPGVQGLLGGWGAMVDNLQEQNEALLRQLAESRKSEDELDSKLRALRAERRQLEATCAEQAKVIADLRARIEALAARQ